MLAWHYGTIAQLSALDRQTPAQHNDTQIQQTSYYSLAHHHFQTAISLSSPTSPYAHRLYGLWAFKQAVSDRFQLSAKSSPLFSRLLEIALRHYRLAIELMPSLAKEALENYFKFTQDYDQLKEILPFTPEAINQLDLFYKSHRQESDKSGK